MVWAAIDHNFKSELFIVKGHLNARQYVNRMLRPVIRPMFRQPPGLAFQHDNVRPHVARATRDFLLTNNINVPPVAGIFTGL